MVERLTSEECQTEFSETVKIISQLIDVNSENSNFLNGVSKFCTRVKKYKEQTSKLSSSFHSFGIDSYP